MVNDKSFQIRGKNKSEDFFSETKNVFNISVHRGSRLRILTSFFHSQDSRSISYLSFFPLGVQKILNRDK